MQATAAHPIDEREYKRRIRAWTLYDWANSAFATTILAAVLPIYYSQVAGATLPSAAVATSYWSLGLSVSLIVAAILSPILGTISDINRGKKRFLAVFVGVGVLGTAALVFVGTGDWFIASMIAIVGRIGFTGANTFYDALLPHVARPEDQDSVSARGYAMGYLGGGLLLAINAVMIFALGFEEGARWSFLSVAIWWAVFSIPIFRQVPEPVTVGEKLAPGETVISASFKRIAETLRDIRRYRELFKFLIAFLIYNDAIGTIIGVAAIYGAELGFGQIELILALLLVQFVGIPFSLIFGSLPSAANSRRPFLLAFIVFNMIALPLTGIIGARVLPQDVTGVLLPPFETVEQFQGTGTHDAEALIVTGEWESEAVAAAEGAIYRRTAEAGASVDVPFNGQDVTVIYSSGPDHGIYAVLLDGEPLLDEDGAPVLLDAYGPTLRYEVTATFSAPTAGQQVLTLVNTGDANPASAGTVLEVGGFTVQPPISASNLPLILGMLIGLQVLGLLFAYLIGRHLFARLARTLNTKRSILLALVIYSIIAMWGFILGSVVEFWMLAWMVAIVQGGSQALSRSLYSSMTPASKSGEFFGLFGVMEKFASFIGPLIFAFTVAVFGRSQPAILALILFFIVGGYLLTRVDVEAGQRVAREEDAALLGRNG